MPNFYASDQKKLQADSKLWRNFHIIVATEHPEKTKKLLPASTTLPFFSQEIGFINSAQKIVFLTDRHLFGKKQRQKSLKKTKQVTRLDDLTPGIHVVHLYHGIGKYSGMQKMSINDHEREYIKIEYAGNDKLFVPVDQLDRIERYIGSENPRLHPLSGNNWLETLHLVKANTLQLAKKLLEHYAKRYIAQAPQMTENAEEAEIATSFPYELTPDQKTALQAIYQSLAQAHPVDHLLCGDVGFGKTELAIRAAVRAVLNGWQVAVLVPTTILAQQHYDTFQERLKHLPINIRLISRWQKPAQQKKITAEIVDGRTDIIIGTHRLLSADIRFKKIGLVIIDEEQRFGIEQKEKLIQISQNIHTLHLSATPIPRTLHLSLSGLRPISYIQTPPTGRKEIKTFVKPASDTLVKQVIEREVARDGQVYMLHNHVQSINRRAQELRLLLPKMKIGIAHGQMEDKQLAEMMHAFDTGQVDVLLCSTIIENGLDLPNVNTLIVEDATRFGLSQLYQLRGRIGRGDKQAFAYFLFSGQKMTVEARLRLQAIEEAVSLGAGLELARRDMEIRGVGSILGKKQHGHATAIGLNLYTRLLNQAVEEIRTGEEPEAIRDITIDLPLDAVIPQDVEHDATKRLNLYRQLANIQNLEELNEERRRLQKRFKQPALKNIFSLFELKLLAQPSIITSIDTLYPNSSDSDASPKIIIKTLEKIPAEKIPEPWVAVGEYQIKTLQKKLGKDWLGAVKTMVKKLKK
ncbi:MAG: hypothetical protein A3F54_03885 [Candidatus Kerfeldbacteria bacterium RIFCSPHIGHO2_12_FULL_48_17]|uniref:TRCF n=1 Tax=Candidatus Kerfeldbacteria bacterium RIFCSPHIGHO2_12_FULL_48_17 TaxID=1798542 RepID=A0A1G2B539_9BACT|nr:MAG: hypothetical protein A3F54_03885 [Candidatus Kerfeldbacteria bacterium RIFCSPHIGHO2_12_FULL_48_17]